MSRNGKDLAAEFFQDFFACMIASHCSRYVSPSEWSPREKNYPFYCDGPVYLFQPVVAIKLIETFENYQEQIFWLEDVFVTGKN